jgi:UDP-N-acetyl-2-amino-2-deoxyglucuronate dehydrogenase
MSEKVSFGIVGCGVISTTHADAIGQLRDAQIVACCDVVEARARDFAKRYGIPSSHVYTDISGLLADPVVEAVSICTPSGTHALLATECLWAGKPVLVEKPMDINIDAIDLLISAQKDTGLPLAVISQHRFDAASIYAHNLVAEGHLGVLVVCEAQIKWFRTQEYYDSGDWRGTWSLDGGGALMNQGVHTVDLMRWIMGPVHSVYAVARTIAHERIEVEDVICATITFESGAIGNIIATTAAFPGYPAQLSLHGSEGSVILNGDALASVDLSGAGPSTDVSKELLGAGIAGHAVQVAQGGTRAAEGNKAFTVPSTTTNWGDAHRAQIADFIAAIRTGSNPRQWTYSWQLTSLLEPAERSI